MPEPESFWPFAITFPRYEDLADLVETLRPLRLTNVIPNACSIAPAYESEDYAGVWNIYAALYGTPEQIEVNRNIVTAAFSKFENSSFFTEKDLGEHPSFKMRANLMKGFVPEIPFKRNNVEALIKARDCYLELTEELAQNGYGLYRTNIAFMDVVGATYGPIIQNVFKKIKRALDPNEIISPGKAGIKI